MPTDIKLCARIAQHPHPAIPGGEIWTISILELNDAGDPTFVIADFISGVRVDDTTAETLWSAVREGMVQKLKGPLT